MTLSDLRTLLSNHQQLDLDNYAGASPSSSDLNEQINIAYRWICANTRCRFKHAQVLTLTDSTEEYDLHSASVIPEKVIQITGLTINGNKKTLQGMAEFQANNPNYMSYADGVPSIGVFHSGRYLLLSPAPTAAVVSDGNNYVAGFTIPADMSDNAAVPVIPYQYHECIAIVAAAFSSTPLVSEAEGWARIDRYDQRTAMMLRKLARESAAQFAESASNRGDQADWVSSVVW